MIAPITDYIYLALVITVMAVVTFLLRAAPFIATRWLSRYAVIARLGAFLPTAIMLLLLLDALNGHMQKNTLAPWPEIAAVMLTVLAHLYWRKPFLTLAIGTGCYVLWLNVFSS